MSKFTSISKLQTVLLCCLFYEAIYFSDAKERFDSSNIVPNVRTKVFSDKSVWNITSNYIRRSRHVQIHPRCRRYAQQFYAPYQHINTYVYNNPYRPYIVRPLCIDNKCNTYCLRCPTCCPRPCPFPTAAPAIRTTYSPYRSSVPSTFKTTVTSKSTKATSRTTVRTTTTNKGANPNASIIIKSSIRK